MQNGSRSLVRRAMLLGALSAGVPLFAACKSEEEKDKDDKTPLTYQGASTIAESILTEAIPAFEKETGIAVSKASNDGSGEGFKATMNGDAYRWSCNWHSALPPATRAR